MSLYVHGRSNGRTITEAERAQARERNQALAAELRQLEAIREQLQASANELRSRLEAERDQAKAELAALRAEKTALLDQTQELMQIRRRMAELPPPVYGGRDGLLAATAEIEAHDRPDREAGPSHGTRARYYGHHCRCAECVAWHENHKAQARARHHNPARHLVAAA